jgi:hypothetical protein
VRVASPFPLARNYQAVFGEAVNEVRVDGGPDGGHTRKEDKSDFVGNVSTALPPSHRLWDHPESFSVSRERWRDWILSQLRQNGEIAV